MIDVKCGYCQGGNFKIITEDNRFYYIRCIDCNATLGEFRTDNFDYRIQLTTPPRKGRRIKLDPAE